MVIQHGDGKQHKKTLVTINFDIKGHALFILSPHKFKFAIKMMISQLSWLPIPGWRKGSLVYVFA